MDDEVIEVKYNGATLHYTGQYNKWDENKVVTFQSCNNHHPGHLMIEGMYIPTITMNVVFKNISCSKLYKKRFFQGSDYGEIDNCKSGGLILHCTATDENNLWHNFKSDKNNWIDEKGEVPCETPQENLGHVFYSGWKKLGAKKIWAARKKVKLIGSPLLYRANEKILLNNLLNSS